MQKHLEVQSIYLRANLSQSLPLKENILYLISLQVTLLMCTFPLCKIFNVQVDDRLRYSGVSKYSFNNRFWVGIIDLVKVWILIKKGEKNGN